MADLLMRGVIVYIEIVDALLWIKGILGFSNKVRGEERRMGGAKRRPYTSTYYCSIIINNLLLVASSSQNTMSPEAGSRSDVDESEYAQTEILRAAYCAHYLFMLFIAQGASIVSASLYQFYLLWSISGAPGDEPLGYMQAMINVLFMLLGKLFVTNGIVTYISVLKGGRYKIDVAKVWPKRHKPSYIKYFILASTVPVSVCCTLINYLCITKREGKDWVVTTCPGTLPESDYFIGKGGS